MPILARVKLFCLLSLLLTSGCAKSPSKEEWSVAQEDQNEVSQGQTIYCGVTLKHADHLRATVAVEGGLANLLLYKDDNGDKTTLASQQNTANAVFEVDVSEKSIVLLQIQPVSGKVTARYKMETRLLPHVTGDEVQDVPEVVLDPAMDPFISFKDAEKINKDRIAFQSILKQGQMFGGLRYRLLDAKGAALSEGTVSMAPIGDGRVFKCNFYDPALRKTKTVLVGLTGSGSFVRK
jgi:hypothetical protein